jgi:hypothetical protein
MTSQPVPGEGIKDLLPIPDTVQPVTDPDQGQLHTDSQDTPTLSHALATEAAEKPEELHGEVGVAQGDHEEEVVDLGWNEPASQIANPLIGGMKNEDLWLLTRRFNKVNLKCWPSDALY